MFIIYKEKELELRFDFTALKLLDKKVGLNYEQVNLGQGLSTFAGYLQSNSIIALAAGIEAGLEHYRLKYGSAHVPTTDREMDTLLNDIAENEDGIENMCKGMLNELGKRPLTRSLLSKELKEQYKVSAQDTIPTPAQETPQPAPAEEPVQPQIQPATQTTP